jgi:hypothetical protein
MVEDKIEHRHYRHAVAAIAPTAENEIRVGIVAPREWLLSA